MAALLSICGVDVITAAKIISSVVDIGWFSSSAKLAKFGRYCSQRKKHIKKYLHSIIYFMTYK